MGYTSGLRASYSQVGENQVYFWITKAMPANSNFGNIEALKLIKEWLRPFSNELMHTVVNNIQPELLIHSDLYDFKPISKWYEGKIVLLGDAAHATTPNLGQGASQAIEDAYVLAACLTNTNKLEDAFALYQAKRIKRVKKIVAISWQLAMITNFSSPVLRSIRNMTIRATPDFITQKQFDVLYGIDLDK